MSEKQLGMVWKSKPSENEPVEAVVAPDTVALWPERWPAIALDECIEIVAAAPPSERAEVKFNLPCGECPKKTSCLNAKKKELGPLLYDREIMTEPRTSESSLFPHELWTPMKFKFPCVRHWQPPFSMEHEYKIAQAWDIAWSEKTGGDYLVCITASVHLPTGRRRLLDIERWQRLSFDSQIELIEMKWRQFGSDMVVIESDAAQSIWAQRTAKTTPVPVVRHSAGGKTDLAMGVPSILIQLSNRKWEIPWVPGSYHHDEVSNMLDEFAAFGWNDGRLEGIGEHDDTVMCFWHASWAIDRLTRFVGGGTEHRVGHVGGAEL